ncbi:MAG: glycosyl hydrolase [Bacteroidia bacterium]|nr:glycosyl hydrolase [Bacteroidia bacterium]
MINTSYHINTKINSIMKPMPLLLLLFIATVTLLKAADQVKPKVAADLTLQTLKAGWNKPARTYRPHTRWWWPGNALTKADITFQLEQMARQGMGGVEIMTAFQMYENGNAEYLSPEHLELMKHAVAEAKRLDIEVAITFGPGWSFGGPWVKPEDQSKVLCMGNLDLAGGTRFVGKLPQPKTVKEMEKVDAGLVIAVVAAQINGQDQLDGNTLTVLTGKIKPGSTTLEWDVPPGKWRLMAFWLKRTGQENQAYSGPKPSMVIDHLSQSAMQNYCNYLGGILTQSLGNEFGRTVDSFFCDSFEIQSLPNSLLWSNDLLTIFKKEYGYDFAKYLPSIWFNIGPQTSRVRYDLGHFLSDLGLKTVFKTFNDWCAAHKVQARIQPHYRFTEELVEGAGSIARPETEVTTTRFEPIADPHKATTSGARFYGSKIVSAESYTFIHPDRYRTSLQDMKIATDAFLRDGITQFYNHGYFASPEMHVAPSRDMPWASRISHWNTWWNYYHYLTEYVSRSASLLRQGQLVADVLIYSPQATMWSEQALYGNDRRIMPYGDLAKTLVANGYDFDIVNDDLLQHRAKFQGGKVDINGYSYRVLLLPAAKVLPIETARAINDFAKSGGTVIALEELPSASAGLNNAESNDRELKQIISSLFTGKTKAVFLPEYKIVTPPFVPTQQVPFKPTTPLNEQQHDLLASLEKVTPPDFALAGRAQSDGLTFIHKRINDLDVYFVTNLQPNRIVTDVTFRVTGKKPQCWNALTGSTGEEVLGFRVDSNGTTIPLDFEPWESAFFIFTPGVNTPTPVKANAKLPEPFPIAGNWNMKLEGYGFDTFETTTNMLTSWTNAPRTQHFSGTGRYETEFTLSAKQLENKGRMILDLGAVGDVADVQLNGQSIGVVWMLPYRLDIARAAHAGKNKLVVLVTNQLVNYVSGLKEAPDVPVELQSRLGKANTSIYKQSNIAKKDMSQTDLPPSGLMGPIQIVWRDKL